MSALTDGIEGPFENRRRLALGTFGVLLLAAVPFSTTAYVTELVFTGLVFVILGVSWNLLAGYAGQISLGHAAFFGIGAFVSAWLTTPARAGLPEALQMPIISFAGGRCRRRRVVSVAHRSRHLPVERLLLRYRNVGACHYYRVTLARPASLFGRLNRLLCPEFDQ